jgi:outer membrane protein TolC
MGMELKDELILTEELEEYINKNTELLTETPQIQNRIESDLLDLQAKFDSLEIRKVRSEYFPDLVAFGNVGRSYQADDLKVFEREWFPTTIVGLKLSIPVFDGFRKRGVMNQKKVQQLQNNNTRLAFEKVFDVEVKNARTAYANALESMRNQKNNLQLADKIYRVSKIKYNEGLGSSLELTTAESQQNETRSLYVQSLYELVLAINQLKKSLGKL